MPSEQKKKIWETALKENNVFDSAYLSINI